MENRIAEVQARLEAIAEELTDISIEVLRTAVEEGETRRPPIDKKLAQARRAVEKAARSLDPAPTTDGEWSD
ncbi:MAG: hypothetical protein AAF547_00990 [Actinomycetota bacterium]